MKTKGYFTFRSLSVAFLAIALLISAAACGNGEVAAYDDVMVVDEAGNTSVDGVALSETLRGITASDLTDIESEGLLFMREEEKLARDVYLTLYDLWGQNIFQNIANSEQTHMDAVKTLLDRYELDDPAAGQEIGAFENETLQGLYDQLVQEGSASLEAALKVGAAIEEIDIMDLEDWLQDTDKADIETVYQNLLKGSRNHLRSFVRTLGRQTDAAYTPQYLTQDAYDAIVGGEMETGPSQGGNGRRGRR